MDYVMVSQTVDHDPLPALRRISVVYPHSVLSTQ
jgi:hypothetical protein